MILPWIGAVAALAAALAAWARTRRLSRRLDQLSQMYWELKYQHSELRSQLQRMPGEPHKPALSSVDASAQPASAAFVPLASLKR
ncbi:MAG TPA: hypothetical protein VL173_11825 [Vicinamibacterales bacterium]|jgi:hypothetical protein|nr:hypothetical protein [Vicinamibacterales bacterium]